MRGMEAGRKGTRDGHSSMKHCNGPFGSKPLGFRTYKTVRMRSAHVGSGRCELLNVTIKCCGGINTGTTICHDEIFSHQTLRYNDT